MSLNQVPNTLPKTILEATSKSGSFTSNKIPIDANNNLAISVHTASSSSLECVCIIQTSHDGETWFDLPGTDLFINDDGDFLWTLNDINALMQVQVSVSISAGSAIFQIIYRGS